MTDKLREALERILRRIELDKHVQVCGVDSDQSKVSELYRMPSIEDIARAALAAPSAEPVASVEACMQLADAYRKTPELSATGFTNPGFKPARDRLQAAVAQLAAPAQPPAAQHTAQSRLSDELSDLYSMGFSDGSKQADDPETNEQRRAAAINLVLGRLTAAAPSAEAEPVPGRAAAGEMPPLPKKRRAMLCTKCGYSGETQADATDRGVPCERPCGYLAIVSECDYNDEEMHAYARSCMAAAPKGPVPDAQTEEPPVLQGELHLWRHQIQHQDARSQGPLLFDDTP